MSFNNIEENNRNFLVACNSGNVNTIKLLFDQASPHLYPEGLNGFLDFLAKYPPHQSAVIAISAYQKVLKKFAQRLDLYNWEFIAAQIKKLYELYRPAAKTLFRSFLKPMIFLYALVQTKKPACSRFPVSTAQEFTSKKVEEFVQERHVSMIHFPILQLLYQSNKTGKLKHTVNLGRQHIELKANLPYVTAGNAATSALTFMLKVSRAGQEKKYLEVTLPIIIPTNANLDNRALHFDELACDARSHKPYEKLKILFDQGLCFFKVSKKQHGHHPEYSNVHKAHAADSIKHSEQALALYLYEESHVQGLVNQLVLKLHQMGDTIKAADTIKVIAIALHFHSRKTPCAVCETVLTGLMDRENGGFLKLFKNTLLNTQDIFKFCMPKTGIHLHVLYSADNTDADHKENNHQRVVVPTQHSMRHKSGFVFCSLFHHGNTLNYRTLGFTPSHTVLSSGGVSSEKKRGTNAKINNEHKKGRDEGVLAHKEFYELIEYEAKVKKFNDQQVRYGQFKPWLFKQLGMQILPVLGDGNCQFRAIAMQLLQLYPANGYSLEGLVVQLRALSEQYLRNHRRDFEPLIGAEDFPDNWLGATNFDAYLDYIKRDQAWGDEHTLRALANIIGHPIFVLHPDMMNNGAIEHRIYLPQGRVLDDFELHKLLVVSYNGANHYDTICDRPTQQLFELINPVAQCGIK